MWQEDVGAPPPPPCPTARSAAPFGQEGGGAGTFPQSLPKAYSRGGGEPLAPFPTVRTCPGAVHQSVAV